jgi:hypothetical protein
VQPQVKVFVPVELLNVIVGVHVGLGGLIAAETLQLLEPSHHPSTGLLPPPEMTAPRLAVLESVKFIFTPCLQALGNAEVNCV